MRLNQITLPVEDMAESVAFYLQLGFRQIVDTPHYARFMCDDGEATFSLSLQSQPVENGAVIYFETEKLDELVAELQQRGFEFEQMPTEQRHLWKEAVLYDPSGNKIKLYTAGENRLNPPWRVDIKRAS